jgi:dTDP-4-dehydrorhamnose 3,5-epimerase-like enzyme
MSHQIIEPIYTRRDERGEFQEIIREYPWYTVIVGQMHPGSEMGHHYHIETCIFFYLLSGSASIRMIDVVTQAKSFHDIRAGQGVLLVPNQAHAIRFLEESNFLMLKSIGYNPENPDTYSFPVPDN